MNIKKKMGEFGCHCQGLSYALQLGIFGVNICFCLYLLFVCISAFQTASVHEAQKANYGKRIQKSQMAAGNRDLQRISSSVRVANGAVGMAHKPAVIFPCTLHSEASSFMLKDKMTFFFVIKPNLLGSDHVRMRNIFHLLTFCFCFINVSIQCIDR